jgi:hypothetical protein
MVKTELALRNLASLIVSGRCLLGMAVHLEDTCPERSLTSRPCMKAVGAYEKRQIKFLI